MTDIFYLDSRKLVGRAMVEHAKRENLNLYHCEALDDCLYIIKDLNPKIIVLNLSHQIAELKAIQDWSHENNLKVIYCGTTQEIDLARLVDESCIIQAPFSPDVVIRKILEFI